MKTTTHSPGPWTIEGHFDPEGIGFGMGYIEIGGRVVCTADGATQEASVARVICAGGNGRPEDKANARLIAAAPALFDALEGLAVWNDGEPCFCHVHGDEGRARHSPHNAYCDAARAALGKVEGPE